MIKFFRKIRQDLLSKVKTGKYLKYAIGEIVLVVIGILIALQINNWNNESANRDNEINLLTQMIRNLNMNMNQFSDKIEKQNLIVWKIDDLYH